MVHHTELIAELVNTGRLRLITPMDKKVTYHDPCYLGCCNGIFQAPRMILSSIPMVEFVEMKRTRRESFCCGGGGSHMWLEENVGKRINVMRTQDVIETQVDFVATACPYCLQMLEEGVRKNRQQGSIIWLWIFPS